jgi:hypothetical protein
MLFQAQAFDAQRLSLGDRPGEPARFDRASMELRENE